MVCCVGSILLFNSLCLESLYINRRKNVIKRTYSIIDDGVSDAYKNGLNLSDLFKQSRYIIPPTGEGPIPGYRSREEMYNEENESSLSRLLREIMTVHNISVVFVDEKNVKYSIFSNNQRFDRNMNNYVFGSIKENKNYKILEENPKYIVTIHENNNDESPSNRRFGFRQNFNRDNPSRELTEIECFGFLSDNLTQVFMTTPVMSIKEPISLFNTILIIASSIVIVLGSFVIYFTSKKLTKPLTEMASLSKKMANMDFESKYEGKSEDELGVLGGNFNELSDKLEKTIKELKNANVQLKNDLEQKEKLDNMRKDFIASVSHELKTPIALIEGYAEGLEGNIADNKEDRDYYVKVIKDEAEKMNMQVRQLLNLIELEKNIDNMDIKRVRLKDAVDGIYEAHALECKNSNIDVNIDIGENVLVWADEYRLEEIVTNYLTNAIRYIDDKKIIKIYTEDKGNNKLRLYVYNTASPFDDETINNIWEKYYKIDKARSRSLGGTGLGLSIVKAIANKMDTTCGVENYEDGVRFYFDFNTK